MSYNQLPLNTRLSEYQFIAEMNKALQSLFGYKSGMEVRCDSNGYWLELNGVEQLDDNDLLAAARKLVLGS
jgi:hypothetical protein